MASRSPPSAQWLSLPEPPRLMLATSIVDALAVTQSIPQITEDQVPLPLLSRTRTAHSRAPGATPTTPAPSSLAAAVPATWVPWPLPSSLVLPVEQFTPPTTLRSG